MLTWRPLVYLGTVSYGIYLFHLFVVPVTEIIERSTGVNVPVPGAGPGRFVAVGGIAIALASLSWTFLERPINQQKHRFPYVRGAGVTRAASTSRAEPDLTTPARQHPASA